jgi:hypothetical protein
LIQYSKAKKPTVKNNQVIPFATHQFLSSKLRSTERGAKRMFSNKLAIPSNKFFITEGFKFTPKIGKLFQQAKELFLSPQKFLS